MDRELLKKVIADQKEYPAPKNFYGRSQTEAIRALANDPHILIISGVRRSGKSTLLRHIQNERSESDYYINFDDDRLIHFKLEDFQILYEVFIELFGKQSTFYFDEIQNIEGWETFVRRLHDQGNKIYITGSNATLLSRELGTRLTGRYISLEMYPLSFREIVNHELPEILDKKLLTTTDVGLALRLFSSYMQNGGIPDYVKFGKIEYLKSLYEGILYRDVIVRYGITNEKPLKELCFYLASNIGKEFSYNNLCKLLEIGSANTISGYCDHLENCYLCFFVNRYSHSLQKQIHYNKKCYMIDSALIRLIGFRVSEDKGRLLENCVLLQLKRKNEEIFFHKGKKECDFLLRKGNRIFQAIQVTRSLADPQTRQRELEGLLEAMEEYQLNEGLILTESDEEQLETKGCRIQITPIWKWLLSSSV